MRYVKPPGLLLTTIDCARRLGVCPDYIRMLARAGHLRVAAVAPRGRYLQRFYTEDEIARYQREHDRRERARLRGGIITDAPDRDDAL